MEQRRLGINNTGFITLISVLVVSAVSVTITTTLILLGLGSSRTSLVLEQSIQAKNLANSCAEEALEQIRRNSSFSGPGGISLNNRSCSYLITDLGGQNKLINTSSTVGTVVRKVTVTINTVTPLINVASWQEIP